MTGPEFIAWARELVEMGATEVTAGDMSAKFAPKTAPRAPAKPVQEPPPVDPKEARQLERNGILNLMRDHG